MLNVSTSLVRFWEKEFKQLKPKKSARGIRQYTQKDIDVLKSIYELVKTKGYTLDGAKKELKKPKTTKNTNKLIINKLNIIRDHLKQLKTEL